MSDLDLRRQMDPQRSSRHDFKTHLVVYALVNTMLIVIWAVSGAGYFWPVWPLMGWGIGLALHGWNTYGNSA